MKKKYFLKLHEGGRAIRILIVYAFMLAPIISFSETYTTIQNGSRECFSADVNSGNIINIQYTFNLTNDSVDLIHYNTPVFNAAADSQSTMLVVTDNISSLTCIADLSLTKIVNNAVPKKRDEVTYTITNDGPLNATRITTVTDLLSLGLIDITYTTLSGSYNNGINLKTMGNVNAGGDSKEIEIKTKVSNAEVLVSSTAEIQQSNQPDIDSSNNGN